MIDSYALLLDPEIQGFINKNLNTPPTDLMLRYKDVNGVPIKQLVQQIQGKQKAKQKLPTWYNTPNIVFPPVISLEQSSSEATANYKARLLGGEHLLDLTGGLGIDSAAFARNFKEVSYVERNRELFEIASHNFRILGIENVKGYNKDSEDMLEEVDHVDVIYIDPARRDNANKKVFRLQDCEPNVIDLIGKIKSKCSTLLIKTSPILDLEAAILELGEIAEIHIVALANECKEVLYLIQKKTTSATIIHTINIHGDQHQQYNFRPDEEKNAQVAFSLPLKFLYEPNGAILKAGAFKRVGIDYNLKKLHPNSHLYTSEGLIENFPGRKFEISAVLKYNKAEVKKQLSSSYANITARNFPESVDVIRKKLGLKEGGDYYLFATIDLNNRPIILATRKPNALLP